MDAKESLPSARLLDRTSEMVLSCLVTVEIVVVWPEVIITVLLPLGTSCCPCMLSLLIIFLTRIVRQVCLIVVPDV